MIEFSIKVAEHVFSVSANYPQTKEYCKDYLVEGNGVPIIITKNDLDYEKELSEEKHLPMWYNETAALLRKISDVLIRDNIILFHSSAVAVDGSSYVFAAPSGTGKSTHTRLWKELLKDRLSFVNGDKPFMKIQEDGIIVYGSPWDGKERLSNNCSMPLKAICFLSRGEQNTIERIGSDEAFARLMKQTYRPSDPKDYLKTIGLVKKMSRLVSLWALSCNMDPSAAKVSYEAMANRGESK